MARQRIPSFLNLFICLITRFGKNPLGADGHFWWKNEKIKEKKKFTGQE